MIEPRKGDTHPVTNETLVTNSLSPLRGSQQIMTLTQGSQSLTLGLTLIAAPQLVSAGLHWPIEYPTKRLPFAANKIPATSSVTKRSSKSLSLTSRSTIPF